ncbi:MAG: Glycosyl transferase group 1 [Candidatus Yanofskybacteria bacterium GW2011_GWA2_44_9]|uniref:Glycosyl transferase group 1 n=1 Tax=Candidatus Yanofskybacteria bacterium GW2011_GWA2_44_9 TaxID=1619025 RepID=A0A0G1KE62_9BACT|nr:MAG: Glycosyl transferase group 1 [Candidatus Yanofskybacteria bacterium GW2011_GWA2_44_9]
MYTLVRRLTPEKYQILVAVGQDGGKMFQEQLRRNGIPVHDLKFLRRETAPVKDVKAVSEIRNLIKSFRPETIFLNSSKAGFIGSLATALLRYHTTRPKVIYRIGGWTFNDPWPAWKRWLWVRLEKLGSSWKDVIVVNNEHDLRQAQKMKIIPRDRLALIHNGLDTYKTSYLPREEARLKLFEKIARHSGKIFQAKNIVGTIANFYPPKGLEYFILTAEKFKDIEDTAFIIIGDGQERQKLELMIAEHGLSHKIFLLGQIPEASKFITAFDVFVLPSVKEGFPWALIEAMAAKTPVIATNVGAVPEIIEDGKNGFMVEPKNPDQIANRIREILGNDRLRQELSIQAHQTVLFKFSEDKMVKEIESLL